MGTRMFFAVSNSHTIAKQRATLPSFGSDAASVSRSLLSSLHSLSRVRVDSGVHCMLGAMAMRGSTASRVMAVTSLESASTSRLGFSGPVAGVHPAAAARRRCRVHQAGSEERTVVVQLESVDRDFNLAASLRRWLQKRLVTQQHRQTNHSDAKSMGAHRCSKFILRTAAAAAAVGPDLTAVRFQCAQHENWRESQVSSSRLTAERRWI